ncbi:hypothetical protein GRF29_96g582001 [Pseudopithomyces chartarum]|uniref:Uncharacterized protein n=1 Tax=Pseudopithomyces chartarum TaxID=1892770 RepID=A0AAN6LYT7_9PLEO|nr:hypothetical protein GRF29_96g582001 [Pseudopithomyces chartarum]
MSSSTAITIPQRRTKRRNGGEGSNSSPANAGFQYGSFESVKEEDMAASPKVASERRPSLMSPAFSRAEHTVINIGDAEMPRLITCVKASQGFDWNQEIFLPSYANFDFGDLERKQDPVQEIVVTDEEIAKMFPS